MTKKGIEFAVGTVIMIVLGLIVLVILAVMIRQQVTKGAKQTEALTPSVETLGDCPNLVLGWTCKKECPDVERVTGVNIKCPTTAPVCCKLL